MTPVIHPHRGSWQLPGLRAWRMARFLTQEELALRAGISRPTLSRAEQGKPIYWASVRRIAAALRVRPELLLHDPSVSD